MKRTMHGEKLQTRLGGNVVGLYPKRSFPLRDVWCPKCGALPNRKCQVMPEDRGTWRMKGKQLRADHVERLDRATHLRTLAEESRERLYSLAWKPDQRPEQQSERGLPLFHGVTP